MHRNPIALTNTEQLSAQLSEKKRELAAIVAEKDHLNKEVSSEMQQLQRYEKQAEQYMGEVVKKDKSFTGSHQLMSTQKWTDIYVYADILGMIIGFRGDPGQQGHWNFTQIGSTNKYLLSPQRWPNWYLYMQGHTVSGWRGDPGPQGHWMITQKGTVSVGDQSLPTYVFTTEQYPNRYMYMQNFFQGKLCGWDGDPGVQGYFIMRKTP